MFNLTQQKIELLSDTEANLQCTGICSTSFFYFSRAISNGRPEYRCYLYIFSLNKDTPMIYGVLALIHFSLLSISKLFLDKVYERKIVYKE